MEDWRSGSQQEAILLRVAHQLMNLAEVRLPIGRNGVHEGEEVGDAYIVYRTSIQIGRVTQSAVSSAGVRWRHLAAPHFTGQVAANCPGIIIIISQ